ncbi:MAG: DUF4446 family protein [Lachnospiraceae bacterium]|nr:DUF4446 family protein [Lachnospiraceae bacterium]
MFLELIEENAAVILIVLSAIIVIFAVFLILALKREQDLRRRYNFFMGANSHPDANLETAIKEYINRTKEIDRKYTEVLSCIEDMKSNIDKCIQKIGIVRYNPFSEMGGKLCFAIAIMDKDNNGIVLNGIHSRTGSYTYAKPIENAESSYTLSEEEKEAVHLALESTYKKRYDFAKLLAEKPSKIYRIKATNRNIKKEKAHIEELYKLASEALISAEKSKEPGYAIENNKKSGEAS